MVIARDRTGYAMDPINVYRGFHLHGQQTAVCGRDGTLTFFIKRVSIVDQSA
jgi:hypothetical protein